MSVYYCDEDTQYAVLEQRSTDDQLTQRDLIQTFGPDSLPEARNRGFRPR